MLAGGRTSISKGLKPPVKAAMISVRGRDGREVRGEDWDRIQHEVYTSLLPQKVVGSDYGYGLVILVPGMEPMRTDAWMYRGCNCLAVPSEVVQYL